METLVDKLYKINYILKGEIHLFMSLDVTVWPSASLPIH